MNTTQTPDPWPKDERRVAVIIPSRDRVVQLYDSITSVLNTSTCADVLVYIDEDQYDLYKALMHEDRRVRYHFGPRVGPVASINYWHQILGDKYAAYGMITDDSKITTPGWDKWLLAALDQFPNHVLVVSPHHNNGDHVDMPFVSVEWANTLGWVACPHAYHYVWPIITGLIGEMTAIVHAPQKAFHIEHEYEEGTYPERRAQDYAAFFQYCTVVLRDDVRKIRERMHGGPDHGTH